MTEPVNKITESSSRTGVRLKGPMLAGLCAISIFTALAFVGARSNVPLGGYHLAEARPAARTIQPVVHPGGRIAAVHVEVGKAVAAGDILATIESGDLDGRIAALKVQSEAAQLHLQAVRREAQAFTTLLEQRLVSRQRVVELERQIADLEREAASVLARVEAAQAELASTEIRAPVGGILASAENLVAGRTLAAGEVVAAIAPSENTIVFEARLSPSMAKAAQKAGRARMWLGTASWLDARPLVAKLTWLSPVTSDGKPRTAHFELQRSALSSGTATQAASLHNATLSIRIVDKSFLQTLIEPVRRIAGQGSAA